MWFSFAVSQRRVTCYYFYVCTTISAGVCQGVRLLSVSDEDLVNGHEWPNARSPRPDRFSELSNGSPRPPILRAAGDLRPAQPRRDSGIRRTLVSILPLPLTAADRAAVLVGAVNAPGRDLAHPGVRRAPAARLFFEALVADNLDIGRPELIELIFKRGQRRGAKQKANTRPRSSPMAPSQRQRLLPALAYQTVFEGRTGAAYRDRDQRPRRSGLSAPAGPS